MYVIFEISKDIHEIVPFFSFNIGNQMQQIPTSVKISIGLSALTL